MNKKEIKDKLAQMDDIYCEGFQGNIIDRDDLITGLNKILWESLPPKIRDYYNWIMEDVSGPPEFDNMKQTKNNDNNDG